MSYEPVFALFWERVKQSIEDKTFAKLTLAKTIGDTELKNIIENYKGSIHFETEYGKGTRFTVSLPIINS